MTDYYQQNFKEYHQRTFEVDPSAFLEIFVKHLPPRASIFDIGCGSGRDMCWLSRKGYQLVGFERSKELAELARKNTGCLIIEGDFYTYDFSANEFDALLMAASLVHVPHDELKAVLKRITQAIKKKGVLFLSLKKGIGRSKTEDGRVFSLWQHEALLGLFDSISLKIIEYHIDPSTLGNGETFLSYVLKKL